MPQKAGLNIRNKYEELLVHNRESVVPEWRKGYAMDCRSILSWFDSRFWLKSFLVDITGKLLAKKNNRFSIWI
ncbi:MAG TPA: hypothetical protein VGK06_10295 [Methanosarcina sp.]